MLPFLLKRINADASLYQARPPHQSCMITSLQMFGVLADIIVLRARTQAAAAANASTLLDSATLYDVASVCSVARPLTDCLPARCRST